MWVENITFDELTIGQEARIERLLTEKDIALFAIVTGDYNPAHIDKAFAQDTLFHQVIGHGMWGGALISTVLGTRMPGPGTIYLQQSLTFQKPIALGDRIVVRLTVLEKESQKKHVRFRCECINQRSEVVTSGEALVIAPTEKIRREVVELPHLELFTPGEKCLALIELAKKTTKPLTTAIVHPAADIALHGMLEAMQAGLIMPIIIGPMKKINAIAVQAGINIQDIAYVDVPHSHAAAQKAVDLVHEGKVQALMKGALQTSEMMHPIVATVGGLRTDRRITHAFVMDTPAYPRLIIISDAAINIQPNLQVKKDIVQNSIDLAQALGIACPKVAILAAVETVEMQMPATLDAAALAKMAERGQIHGGIVDGPLGFDNAISLAAAAMKNIQSPVAGEPDILIVPEIESGNMLAKQLIYLGSGQSAGIVLGAKVPIILTSRADNVLSKTTSAAIACLYHHWRQGVRK